LDLSKSIHSIKLLIADIIGYSHHDFYLVSSTKYLNESMKLDKFYISNSQISIMLRLKGDNDIPSVYYNIFAAAAKRCLPGCTFQKKLMSSSVRAAELRDPLCCGLFTSTAKFSLPTKSLSFLIDTSHYIFILSRSFATATLSSVAPCAANSSAIQTSGNVMLLFPEYFNLLVSFTSISGLRCTYLRGGYVVVTQILSYLKLLLNLNKY